MISGNWIRFGILALTVLGWMSFQLAIRAQEQGQPAEGQPAEGQPAAADATEEAATAPGNERPQAPAESKQADARTEKANGQGESPADAASEDASLKPDSVLRMILDSGVTGIVFMGVLALFSLVAVTVAAERAVRVRPSTLLPKSFSEEVSRQASRAISLSRLRQLCSQHTGPAAEVLSVALDRHGRPAHEIEKAMEDTAAREFAELRASIRPLSTVGSVAPLVGLLGTVVGMIIAFHTASQAGLGKAELLAKGIYMALLTTAGGLSVAIPSLLASSFFAARIDRAFRQIDRLLMPLIPKLVHAPPSSAKPNVEETPREEEPAKADRVRAEAKVSGTKESTAQESEAGVAGSAELTKPSAVSQDPARDPNGRSASRSAGPSASNPLDALFPESSESSNGAGGPPAARPAKSKPAAKAAAQTPAEKPAEKKPAEKKPAEKKPAEKKAASGKTSNNPLMRDL